MDILSKMSFPEITRNTKQFVLFGIFVYATRGIELRRKSLVISRRVNSGHPLFIGYGRTGADSPMEVLSRTSFPDVFHRIFKSKFLTAFCDKNH
jgi:hypothetical protein